MGERRYSAVSIVEVWSSGAGEKMNISSRIRREEQKRKALSGEKSHGRGREEKKRGRKRLEIAANHDK